MLVARAASPRSRVKLFRVSVVMSDRAGRGTLAHSGEVLALAAAFSGVIVPESPFLKSVGVPESANASSWSSS
jgi:hypothetical protein